MNSKFQVVWLKRDLRLHDHEPLCQALTDLAEFGRVLLLYVHEPEMLSRPDSATQHFEFAQECLAEMSQAIAKVSGALHVRFGSAVEVLDALSQCPDVSLTRVLAYAETTGPQGFDRDKRVRAWARTRGLEFRELPQNGVNRGSRFRDEGFSFKTYSQWALRTQLSPWPHPVLSSHLRNAVWMDWPLPPQLFELDVSSARSLCNGRDKPNRQKGGRTQADKLRSMFYELPTT